MTEPAQKNPPHKNTKKALVAGSLAAVVAAVGTMAFFTDRVDTNVTAEAGTVDIELTSNWVDVEGFKPGDKTDLTYSIQNDGNKSVDVRERIVVKSSTAMDASEQAEFEIYRAADVEQDVNGAYIPKQDAEPVTTGAERKVSADNTSITYEIEEYTLNGSGFNAEIEDGVTETVKESPYVLVFKDTSGNDFQGATVTVDLVAEAKQHRNTGADTWATISTDSITMGGEAVEVVPGR